MSNCAAKICVKCCNQSFMDKYRPAHSGFILLGRLVNFGIYQARQGPIGVPPGLVDVGREVKCRLIDGINYGANVDLAFHGVVPK